MRSGPAAAFAFLALAACTASSGPGTNGDSAALKAPPDLGGRARLLVNLALVGRCHDMLRELCVVAPARLAGTANADRAVAWGVEVMQRIGLSNVRTEPVMVPRWVRGAPEQCDRLGSDGAAVEALDILALGGSVATPAGGVEAEVIRVRSFEELAERREEAQGKVVFFDRPMPRVLVNTFAAYGEAVPQRTSGASEAAKAGGVFALVRSMTTRIDDSPHTGAMRYEKGVQKIPTAAISTLDAEALSHRIARGETVRLRIRMDCETLPDVESANVIGEIPGSDLADEIVVLGGHLDSWDVGQGAHDDGAGCAHALEAARVIMAAGLRPRRTIRVVLFMNEENGLRGALAYAAAHVDERHFAAIESDRGGFAPRGFTSTARGDALGAYREIADALDPYDMGAMLPGGGGADIGPLGAKGAVLFGLATIAHRYFDYHHSENDVIENVNERELALGAAAVAYLATALADA